MEKTRAERKVKGVNVEIPFTLLEWVDEEAAKHESTRSGILRLAVREMMRKSGCKPNESKDGGAK